MENITPFQMEKNVRYIETPQIRKTVERVLNYLNSGFPVHLRGAAGVGKTSLAFYIAEKVGRPVVFICGSEEFSSFDLVGGYFGFKKSVVVDNYISSVFKKDEEFEKNWLDGRLITACKNGYTLIYDEFTRAKPEANNVLLTILEERILELPNTYTGESYIKVHPEFRAIFTSNPEEYAGVYKSPNALIDRMITVDIDTADLKTQKAIVKAQSGIDDRQAEIIIRILKFLRGADKKESFSSLRSGIMLARVIKNCNMKLSGENQDFRQVCRDVFNSSGIITSFELQERDKYTRLIDKAVDMALGAEGE